MTYLQANKRGNRKTKIILVVCGFAAIVLITLQLLTPHFIPAIFTSIASPFWRAEFSIESGSLKSPEELLRENEDLKLQLIDAQVRMQSIQAVESENNELKALFGRSFGAINPESKLLAAVLIRPPLSAYDQLIIDVGADHNVTVGDDVYAPGDILIGRVSDVMSQTSRVILFSSPNEKYEVLIGSIHAPATAIGRGGGQYSAEVSRDLKISRGDFVIAPSINDKPFGVVASVIADPAKPFEEVLFSPMVNIYQLRWVLVGKIK